METGTLQMTEASKYLQDIAERVLDYDNVRLYTVNYIDELDIDEPELIMTLLVMAFLWKSRERNEELREDELNLLLGVEEENSVSYDTVDPTTTITLDEYQASLTLDEILDITVEEYNDLDRG